MLYVNYISINVGEGRKRNEEPSWQVVRSISYKVSWAAGAQWDSSFQTPRTPETSLVEGRNLEGKPEVCQVNTGLYSSDFFFSFINF